MLFFCILQHVVYVMLFGNLTVLKGKNTYERTRDKKSVPELIVRHTCKYVILNFLLEVVVKTECDVVSVKVNTNGIA